MHDEAKSAVVAARALAVMLSLPSSKGSVFAWRDANGERLVVAGDVQWVLSFREVPAEFCGYPVVLEEPLGGAAQPFLH